MTEAGEKPDREARLRALDAALAASPDALAPRLQRAGLLAALGRSAAARTDYIAVLTRAPTHLDALNDLGTLLHNEGFRSAAQSCYAEAIAHHPDAPLPRVNLANMLREDGDPPAAREHYRRALASDPHLAEAHQGLALALAELGEDDAAAHHREQGFRHRFLVQRPYRGDGDGIPMLILVAAAGGNIPTRFLIDERVYRCSVAVADFFDRAAALPPHAVVFNAIGDADLARPALEAAEALLARTTAPVVNPPRVILPTGRVETARRLAAIRGLIAPRMANYPRAVLAADGTAMLQAHGFAFPLLLRRPGFHTGRYFVRVDRAEQMATAIAALPGDELTAIEFLDACGGDGLARKYRAMMVDGKLYPLHLAIATDWKVHYFTSAMAEHGEHRAEEAAFLADMPSAIGPTAMAALERVRDVLGLDYGGIDFGLDRNGAVLLFEANATMVVNPPEPDPRWDYRRAPVARILDAVRAMLSRRVTPAAGAP
jgi:hypothetical protein